MDENNLPTREDIEITIEVEPEHESPRGWFASGDEAADRAQEDEILARLERGDVWAWCMVRVTGEYTECDEAGSRTFTHDSVLGGCNYESEADFVSAGDYYPGMVEEITDAIRADVERARCLDTIEYAGRRLARNHKGGVRSGVNVLLDILQEGPK